MTATDSEISIEKEIECQVQEPGKIVVSSRLFTDMIKKLPDDDIMIVEEDGVVAIRCRSYNSEIVSLPADEFPDISEVEEIERIVFNKETFKRMVRRTAFAASMDESRGILTGILIETKEGVLTMVALDGFRMSIVREVIETDQEISIVISARILNEITKILTDEEEEDDFVMIFDNKKTVFIIGTTKITSRLLEGSYINYKEIIPKIHNNAVIADKNEMVDVIERASLISNKNNLIRLLFQEDKLVISSRSEEGNIREEMDVLIEGDGLEIGFNSKYVLDALKAVDDEKILLELNTNVTPCMVKPEDGNSFEFLILPVRIS
jgi:DNA polymerase-3 subunit beta